MKKQEIAIFGALVASIIMVYLNSNAAGEAMSLDLQADDPLSCVSYAEALDNYKKHNVSYIVARVEITIDGKPYERFFDAQSFNSMVLGGLSRANDKQLANFQDPVSRSPIVGVDYFILKKDNNGGTILETLCSYKDLFLDQKNREYWKDIFRINQYEDPKLQAKGWLRLGYHYLAGDRRVGKNYEKALDYFLRAQDQTVDEDIANQARQEIRMTFGRESFPKEATSGRDRD